MKNNRTQKSSVVSRQSSVVSLQPSAISNRLFHSSLLVIILIITFWCYHYSFGNEFTSWDDPKCVTENIFIKSFSHANLNMMLFHDAIGDYFNPVTMISYAINYHFSGLNPESYYVTNVIIHLLSSCLMFFLALNLFKAMEKKRYFTHQPPTPYRGLWGLTYHYKEWLAFFCALLFSVHPMHVESVSWIAERPDALYTFFYIAGLIAYIKYIGRDGKFSGSPVKTENIPSLLLVFILFLLSLFSKPMALVFPFSLLAIDVLLKRDKSSSIKTILLEKIPFILVTAVSIFTTYHLEKSSGAALQHQANLIQRFLFASYSFYMYIWKAFIPIPQSSYYPYPDVSPSGYLPALFYLSPLIALATAGIPLFLANSRWLMADSQTRNNNFRVVLFGVLFYFFNMVMVSKIVSSGPYLLADRYTYICYFGIFFPVVYFLCRDVKFYVSTSAFIIFLAIVCEQRTHVWHDSGTLWTDVAEKYPHKIIEAYNSLGNYYFSQHDLDKSYQNYEEALTLNTDDPKVFCNLGILMRAKKQYQSALDYYTKSIKIDSTDAVTYADRGNTYAVTGRFDLALNDYYHSLHLNPNSEVLLANIAYTFLNIKQWDSAIHYYNRLIEINPANADYQRYKEAAEKAKSEK